MKKMTIFFSDLFRRRSARAPAGTARRPSSSSREGRQIGRPPRPDRQSAAPTGTGTGRAWCVRSAVRFSRRFQFNTRRDPGVHYLAGSARFENHVHGLGKSHRGRRRRARWKVYYQLGLSSVRPPRIYYHYIAVCARRVYGQTFKS